MVDTKTEHAYRPGFDRATYRMLRFNFTTKLVRCQWLKAFGLWDLLALEKKQVKRAQRVLRMCREHHPELVEHVHQETFRGVLESSRVALQGVTA